MDTLPVLIVEDDQALRVLLSALLMHEGWTFEAVADGDRAIECIRRKNYRAILLDLMLPGTNGFDVLQFIRAEKRELMQRVIVMTAASNLTLTHFDASSIGALLRKPFDINDLIEKIASVSRTTLPDAPAVEKRQRTSSYRVH